MDTETKEFEPDTKGLTETVSFGSIGGYADAFKRDRAPTQGELLGSLCGTAWKCCNANSNLLAGARLRLYLRSRHGDGMALFVRAAKDAGRHIAHEVPAARIKALRDAGARGKSALLDATDGGRDDIREISQHPILTLLRSPENAGIDGGLSAYDFRWTTQMQLESLGRAYWYVSEEMRIRGGRTPTALRMLNAQMVNEIPDTTGEKWIARYEYGANRLDPADVVRLTCPHPGSPHTGFLSPMRAAIEKVRLARGGDAFINALLKNCGFPLGIITPKDESGTIGQAEAARLQTAFRQATSMDNAGKLLVMGTASVELKTLAFKPAEVIDLERAKELEGQIADCFDVPRTKLWRNDSNRASAESGDLAHAKDAGLPRCARFEEQLNSQLVRIFDPSGRLFVAFDSPVDEDRQTRLEETKTLVAGGILTLNEGRIAQGYDPEPSEIGDCRILPKGAALVSASGRIIGDTAGAPAAKSATPAPADTRIIDQLLNEGYSMSEIAHLHAAQSHGGEL